MEEEWRTVDGWSDYVVSNFGRLYNTRTQRFLKGSLSYGYPSTSLNQNGENKFVLIHRLVAFAFVPGYFDGAVVNHKDGVKQNNRADNLEWITHKENIQHARETGLFPQGRVVRVYDPGPLEPW